MRVVLLALALLLVAVALGAAGVAVLLGLGWTLLFLAACCVGAALLLVRGLKASG